MNSKKLGERYRKLYLKKQAIEAELSDLKDEAISLYAQDPNTAFTGILVRQNKGKRTTAWKKVAEELKPSEELIEKNTKIGQPSFTITVSAPIENVEPATPNKFI